MKTVGVHIPAHPDGESGGIRTANREYPDTLSADFFNHAADALKKVDAGEYQAVFFLNPTRVREVTDVAAAGDRIR